MEFFLGYVRDGAVLLTLDAISNIRDAISLHCRPVVAGSQYPGGHGLGARVIATNPLMYFLHDIFGLLACDALSKGLLNPHLNSSPSIKV